MWIYACHCWASLHECQAASENWRGVRACGIEFALVGVNISFWTQVPLSPWEPSVFSLHVEYFWELLGQGSHFDRRLLVGRFSFLWFSIIFFFLNLQIGNELCVLRALNTANWNLRSRWVQATWIIFPTWGGGGEEKLCDICKFFFRCMRLAEVG